MKVRPMGITILAVIFILLGIYSFLWSMLQFGFGGFQSMTAIFGFSVGGSANLWAGFLGMLTGGVQLVTGIGLLQMKSWAWYLAFIGIGLSILQGVMGLFDGSFICGAISLIIPVGIAIYLLRQEIRDLFGIGTSV